MCIRDRPWVNAAEGTGGSNRARAFSAWQRAGFLSPVVNQEQPHDKASCRAHPALIRPPSPRHLPRLRHHRRRGNLSPGQILNRPFQLLFNHISLSRPRVAPHPFMQASTVPGFGNMELNSRTRNPTDGSSRWSWILMNLHGTLSQAEPSNGSPIVKPARWACHAPGPLAIVTRSIVIPNPASGTTPSPVFSTS